MGRCRHATCNADRRQPRQTPYTNIALSGTADEQSAAETKTINASEIAAPARCPPLHHLAGLFRNAPAAELVQSIEY